MFKIINYYTFNKIIEKKKKMRTSTARKKPIENQCDWRLSVVHKSIGRSSLIQWNVFTHSRDADRMTSSSIFFQFQFIGVLGAFYSLSLSCLFLVFISIFFHLHQLRIFFLGCTWCWVFLFSFHLFDGAPFRTIGWVAFFLFTRVWQKKNPSVTTKWP